MKRLTLDQTWNECLRMWKWISRQCLGKSVRWCRRNVSRLKLVWLEKNGIEERKISQDCFFCDRTPKKGNFNFDCCKCPGIKVDNGFDCVNNSNTKHVFFVAYPRRFYTELKRLNKIRLSRKSK